MAGMMEFIIDPSVRTDSIVGFNNLVDISKRRLSILERAGRIHYSKLSKKANELKEKQRELNSGLSAGSGIFGKLAGMAAAYMGVHTVISGIELASDVAENANKLDAVFQGMASNAKKSMADISKELNMGEVTLSRDFANVGAVMKGLGFNDTTALKNTENMLEAAYDAASFHNLSFEQSIGAIRGAMLGESEALKGATGIIVQDATMSEYASQLGYTWKNLDNANRAQLRLNYTMEQLKKQGAVGDLKKTGDGFANVGRTISEVTTDIKAKFFSSFMETVLPGMIEVRDFMVNNKDKIAGYGSAFADTFMGIASFVKEHKGLILGLFGVYVAYSTVMGIALAIQTGMNIYNNTTTALTLIKTTGLWLKETLVLLYHKGVMLATAGAQEVMTGAQWLLNAAMSANPITLVITALVALGAGIYIAYQKSETFRNAVKSVWTWITNLWSEFKNSPIGGFVIEIAKLMTPLDEIWNAIKKVYDWWNTLKSSFSGGVKVDAKVNTSSIGMDYGGQNYTPSFLGNNTYKGGTVQNKNIANQTKNNVNITIPVSNNVNGKDLANVISKQVKTGVTDYNKNQIKAIGGV